MAKEYEVRVRTIDGRDETSIVQTQPNYAATPHPEESILISGVSLEEAQRAVRELHEDRKFARQLLESMSKHCDVIDIR